MYKTVITHHVEYVMKLLLTVSLAVVLLGIESLAGTTPATTGRVTIQVILWFDTEDYILPASDDAALRLARWLTDQGVRATFKVVGEKARVLEKRGRHDVIAALKKHEIGYHSNWHSVPPTPAQYLNECGWEEGIAEFTRREKPGFDDVARIFGQTPSCYGQPGSSWSPHTHAALRQWGVGIYLDAGQHVNVNGKPFWYGGLLNFYKLTHQLRVGLKTADDLDEARQKFLEARQQLLAEKGGVVSIVYHPCEFVHQKFWDGVNFQGGANPPREAWVLPPVKSAPESQLAYDNFERYVLFMKQFPEVRFVTASEAARHYPDLARKRKYTRQDVVKLCQAHVKATAESNISWIEEEGAVLTPAESFWLLTAVLAHPIATIAVSIELPAAIDGPGQPSKPAPNLVGITDDELHRAARELWNYLRDRKQIPSVVWVGSRGIRPEDYYGLALRSLARTSPVEQELRGLDSGTLRLRTQDHVADEGPHLWRWVIFPPGFRAPGVMAHAKRQAWTLKPAIYRPVE